MFKVTNLINNGKIIAIYNGIIDKKMKKNINLTHCLAAICVLFMVLQVHIFVIANHEEWKMIENILKPLVCERFRSDERYRNGHLNVINALPRRKVLGLHTPQMKEIAKSISRGEMPDIAADGMQAITHFEAWEGKRGHLAHEEAMIWGFLINLQKCTAEEHFALLDKFVPVIDNWAICDAFCANAKWMSKVEKGTLWNYLQKWFNSKREFEVRFAIVTSMCHFLENGWLDTLFAKIDSLDLDIISSEYKRGRISSKEVTKERDCPAQGYVQGNSPYYVRMGIAWLMATSLAKFPEKTRKFATNCNLPDDVIKLYIRKARESFRTRSVKATD